MWIAQMNQWCTSIFYLKMKTKKLLSVDLDYCLTTKDFAEVSDLVCRVLFSLKESEVLFSTYHVDALDLCLRSDAPLDILNIDMHHDVFYDQDKDPPEIRNGMASSANWVGWLCAHQHVSKYTWCKQPFSEEFSQELSDAFSLMYQKSRNYDIVDARNLIFNSKRAVTEKMGESYLKYKPDLEVETRVKKDFFDIKFDYLFVCQSPDYLPKEHHYMYDVLLSVKDHFFKKPHTEKIIRQGGEL